MVNIIGKASQVPCVLRRHTSTHSKKLVNSAAPWNCLRENGQRVSSQSVEQLRRVDSSACVGLHHHDAHSHPDVTFTQPPATAAATHHDPAPPGSSEFRGGLGNCCCSDAARAGSHGAPFLDARERSKLSTAEIRRASQGAILAIPASHRVAGRLPCRSLQEPSRHKNIKIVETVA